MPETAKSFNKVIVVDPKGGQSLERFKPTIFWYTPILMILSAAVLMGVLSWVIRRFGRASEERNWSSESRQEAYSDRPFRTGPRESRG